MHPDSIEKKVCCFGEVLLRFSPLLQAKFIEQASMPVYIGGAELNVATALAQWGRQVKYVTAVPANYLSEEIVNELLRRNIDTTAIQYEGERIGTYYLPTGADLKNSGVIYDRHHSSFAGLQPGSLNWDAILENVSWFHFSAISPALNQASAAVCLEAVQAAARRKIIVSVDLNHRAKLWQYGKQPVEVMPELVSYCQVVMGNIWSAALLLGLPVATGFEHDHNDKEMYLRHAGDTAKAIRQMFPGCTTVANTFRFDEGAGIKYFAALNNNAGQFASAVYSTPAIVDKVGSGDCFMAGLIYGFSQQHSFQHMVEFAAAAAFAKLQQPGDATTSTVSDLQKIIAANG